MAKRIPILPTGALLGLLWGGVIGPAILSLTVGIIALALWREAFDVVFGVLVLSFAAMAIAGAILAMAFLRRSARLAEMQSDFVAAVSHELKTPLAGIRLWVETLEMGRAWDLAEREKISERLNTEVKHLENLVDQVLEWRRLESGKNLFTFEPLLIYQIIHQALERVSLKPHLSEVTVDIPQDLPPIKGDRESLMIVFRNLIDNAIKFAGYNGPITLAAFLKQNEVVVAVTDHGPGISSQERKHIFERFYRAHGRPVPGTGLGLAIVRRIIEGHHGRVYVDSMPGKGSSFYVHLPIFAEES